MKKRMILIGFLIGILVFSGLVFAQVGKPKLPPKLIKIELDGCNGIYNRVKITIKDRSDNEDGFEVFRMVNSGGFESFYRINQEVSGIGGTIVYVDKIAPGNSKIHYKVRAFNSIGVSGWSNDKHINTINCVENKLPPIAECLAVPQQGFIPLTVQFISSGSYDPDGNIVSYKWEFGDGKTSNKPNPSYTYEVVGTYYVKLTVADSDDLKDVCVVKIRAFSEKVPPESECDIEFVYIESEPGEYLDEFEEKQPKTTVLWEIAEPRPDGYFLILKTSYTWDELADPGPIKELLPVKNKHGNNKKFSGANGNYHFVDKDVAYNTVIFYVLRWVCDNPCQEEYGREFGPIQVIIPLKDQD